MWFYKLKEADLFSQPYQFTLDNNTSGKKTIFGGILSLLILIIGIIYLIYLIEKWISNQISPKISIVQRSIYNEAEIDYPLVMFTISLDLFKNVPLQKDVYWTARAQLYSEDPTLFGKVLKIVPCELLNPQYAGYQCIDLQNNKQLFRSGMRQGIILDFFKCLKEAGNQCEELEKIDAMLEQPFSNIKLLFHGQEYDANQQIFQKSQIFMYDGTNLQYMQVNVKKQSVYLDNGWILQNEHQYDTISTEMEFESRSTNLEYMVKKLGKVDNITLFKHNLLRAIINLSDNIIEIHISQIKLGEIIAQFSSLFNILLMLGIVARFFSQFRANDILIKILLNYYYSNPYRQDDCNGTIKQNSNTKQQGQEPVKTFQKILLQSTDRDKVNITTQEKQFKNDNRDLDKKIYQTLYQQMKNDLSISNIYKEIILIRTAVQMLYDPKQWYLLQFVRRKISAQDNQVQTSDNLNLENNQLKFMPDLQFSLPMPFLIKQGDYNIYNISATDHLQQIDLMKKNNSEFNETDQLYMQKIIEDLTKNSKKITELDKRLLSCIYMGKNIYCNSKQVQCSLYNQQIIKNINQKRLI